MDSKPRAIPRPPPTPIAADPVVSPIPEESPAPCPEAGAGELTPTLIREWGPLLKPTGIGLLVALHSFEETTPGHPYYGWAHCTQNALAAYLDTSQDTIARYTNLLQTTGLLQVEEVETPRGKQKLYRTARGLLLPSLALLEYLVFDADTWTRKHVAWLTQRLAPLGPDTELTRLAAIMRRAYQVTIDARGLGNVVAAARLTRANSYVRRRDSAAYQPGLLPPDGSAPCGQGTTPPVAPAEQAASASCGQPAGPDKVRAPREAASCGQASTDIPTPATDSASCGQAGPTYKDAAGRDSAPSGQVPRAGNDRAGESAWSGGEESAQGGLDAGTGDSTPVAPGRESAECGAAAGMESEQGGLAAALVNVDRLTVKDLKNENVNDAPLSDLPASSGVPLAGDADALIGWGTRMLGDGHSLEWHRQCLVENGEETYRWAIEATCRAQAKGKVSKPGAYFTSLLRRRRGSGAADAEHPHPAPAIPPTEPAPDLVAASPSALASNQAAAPPAPATTTGLNEADCGRVWQAALVHLRIGLPVDDYARVLRYAVLLELDAVSGWALLGLPTDFMREQVARRLAGPIGIALGQICGAGINVTAIVLPGQGRLAGNRPTLASVLAQRGEGAQA
jgi:hypothetical protein